MKTFALYKKTRKLFRMIVGTPLRIRLYERLRTQPLTEMSTRDRNKNVSGE
jgi:hypothetical protein